MKRFISAFTAMFCLAAFTVSAQAPQSQEQQLVALVQEIQTQQAKIAENQASIEAKLALVEEAVRTAKIYSSRGGR